MEAIMKGCDDQVNTDKRYNHVKKNCVAFKQNLNMSNPSNAFSFFCFKENYKRPGNKVCYTFYFSGGAHIAIIWSSFTAY